MARTTSHHKGHVTHDKPASPPPPEAASAAGPGGSPDPAASAEGLSRQWQTVAFLWVTAFVFLWAFELLSALFKAL
jgi:hypothetical protein